MARIAGVNIPDGKRFVIALTYVYGIGKSRAEKICKALNIDMSLRTNQLTEDDLKRVRDYLVEEAEGDGDSGFVVLVEGDLRRKVQASVKRIIDLGCYRGIRHVKKLPVRGQRTHTNARTRRGRSIAIAGKKK